MPNALGCRDKHTAVGGRCLLLSLSHDSQAGEMRLLYWVCYL